MWLWTTQKMATYVNMKLKGEPCFYIRNKETREVEASDGRFYGSLVGIEAKEPTENKDFWTMNMEFIDKEEERYIVSTSFNNVSTSLLNCFAWGMDAKSNFKDLWLGLYLKNDFPQISVFQDWKMMSWRYQIDELRAKTKKVRVNWKDTTDREELDKFLRELIIEINDYLQWLNTIDWSEVDFKKDTFIEPVVEDENVDDFPPF